MRDKDHMTFTSHEGLYKFLRMRVGLSNARGTFQPAINVILSTDKRYFAPVCLDDVVIFERSVEGH